MTRLSDTISLCSHKLAPKNFKRYTLEFQMTRLSDTISLCSHKLAPTNLNNIIKDLIIKTSKIVHHMTSDNFRGSLSNHFINLL